jgi:NTE family protein
MPKDDAPESRAREAFRERLRGRRVGVALSAGFFGFYAHAGFLRALEDDLGVAPSALAGTSAGALVAALRAGGLSARDIAARLETLRREDFWERGRLLHLLRSALSGFASWDGYLRGAAFRDRLRERLPVNRFEDLELPLFVATTNVTTRRRELFENGDLAVAVHASCAYPLLFEPVAIGDAHHLDGGLVDKLPLEELVERAGAEVLVVHLLGSDGASAASWRRRPFRAARGLRRGVDALRAELVRWKLRWARERGVDVVVFAPELPRVSPRTMAESGPRAMRAARLETLRIVAEGDFDRGDGVRPPS